MKILAYSICGLLGLCLLVLFGIIYIFDPGWDGVVSSLRLEDGSEYMVTQQCNWSPEQYTVSFYMKPPGGKWGWCYINHQATPWKSSSLKYDRAADAVSIERDGAIQCVLDRKSNIYLRSGMNGVAAPQELAEPPFSFPQQ